MMNEMMPWDNPFWPRNEFGSPKRVFEMGVRELDVAERITKNMQKRNATKKIPVTQTVRINGAYLVYVMGAGCVVGVDA